MTPDTPRCTWCGKPRRRFSMWEQKTLSGEWKRLCNRCATRRLNNPYNAFLQMRRIDAEHPALREGRDELHQDDHIDPA